MYDRYQRMKYNTKEDYLHNKGIGRLLNDTLCHAAKLQRNLQNFDN